MYSIFTVYVINTPLPQRRAAKGGMKARAEWKKTQNNAFLHQKFFLYLYLKVSSSEPLERWATMWPHSEHLVTIWNTPAVNWRRRSPERKSLVLFMIPGLVAIWVPPSCRLQGMAPICEEGGGLSAALPAPLHPLPLLTLRFWRREVARLSLSWLWGTFYIASGVCQCD